MPRRSITSLSQRCIALTGLSKLLYAIVDISSYYDEIKSFHHKLLDESLKSENPCSSETQPFSLKEIPWDRLLDSIIASNPVIRFYAETGNFTGQELRYMSAMICGLSGKEYGIITGFTSHYNLSWSIRQKVGMSPKTTNLRNFLQDLAANGKYESQPAVAPK